MSKYWIFFGVFIAFALSLQIYGVLKISVAQIWITTNNVSFKPNNNTLIFLGEGALKSRSLGKLWSFDYRQPISTNLRDIEIGNTVHIDSKNWVSRLDKDLWKIELDQTQWLVFGEAFKNFPTKSILASGSDFWVVSKGALFPEKIHFPDQGIITLSDRKPSHKFEKLAQKNHISFLDLNKYKEIFLKHIENEWKVETAKTILDR